MIVMQYSFCLPADYDMDIIERRIRDNGARLDDFPGLVFKSYLYARRDDPILPSQENLYAPLYVWQHPHSMQRFLSSPGFAALTQTFGWPTIDIWLLSHAPSAEWAKAQTIAQRQRTAIAPYSQLSNSLSRDAALNSSLAAGGGDALHAWNPTIWQRLQVDFGTNLTDMPMPHDMATTQHYRIGYTAIGSALSE